MKNVYDQVQAFYEHDDKWRAPVSRDWIDGFLRHKAWQGAADDDLKNLWRQLELFILYLMYIDTSDLHKLEQDEYQRAIAWLDRHVSGFTANIRNIGRFFDALHEFYSYLAASRKIQVNLVALENAKEFLSREKRKTPAQSRLHRRDNRLSANEMARLIRENGSEFEGDLAKSIGETAELLMMQLGVFFQDDCFAEDLRRALFLYSGPDELLPEEQDEEFWLGFWDYFLFDYHLLANDLTPLTYFDEQCGSSLSAEQRMLLTQLQAAQFTVFYMNKIVGQEWVECVNLFTDEKFQLPLPEFGLAALKRSLFYGHIFSQDIVMINYVTCVDVSTVLRRRIKEQVIKQKKIFEVQCPQATWNEFFKRHALGVRHAVDRLLHLATVNVTPFALLEKKYPEINGKRAVNREVLSLVAKTMRTYSFSLHDINLAQRMWNDFSQLVNIRVQKPEIWAGAIVYTYSQVNYPHGMPAGKIAADLGIGTKSIYQGRKRLTTALDLSAFDPRYLSEEGLVCSLFLN